MSETPGWSSPDQPQNQPPQNQPPQYGQQPPYGYNQPPTGPTIKPGVIPLRPLAVGEIIDGAIKTMRAYPKLIIGAAAVVAAVTQILGLLVSLPFLDDITSMAALDPNSTSLTQEQLENQLTGAITGFLSGTLLTVLLSLFGTVFLSGFITVVVGHAVLGKPVTFAQAWEEFKPRLLPLLGATLLSGLIITVGLLLCIVPGVFLWVMLALVTPALVLERCGVIDAFGRSRKLTNDAWWRTFGILLLTVVVSWVISWIVSLPFEGIGLAVSGGFGDDPTAVLNAGYLILATIGAIIASTITLPFTSAVTVLLYVDRRMRSEGMDIELQRAAGHGGL
ncbi:YciC family protein [Lentzea sp. JNUCC 0626]|uniref:YciC family protein n=1 Tax=Lentzea sp. JNUCC 0626 TaxID=3367513 RepID=UPI00374A3810